MLARSLTTGLVVLLCLGSGPSLLGQEGRRDDQPKAADLNAVQRRLADLEKQLAVLLKEIETLRKQTKTSATPTAVKTQVRIFSLREAEASEVAKTLKELLQGSDAKKMRIAVHQSTNSLILRGTLEELEELEAVVMRLDNVSMDKKKAKEDGKR